MSKHQLRAEAFALLKRAQKLLDAARVKHEKKQAETQQRAA
jgi:hypothetical protein